MPFDRAVLQIIISNYPPSFCFIPTLFTLANGRGGGVRSYQASRSVILTGSVHKSRSDNVVRMWVQLLQRGHSGDGCGAALCKYDLRKGDLFLMSWARVRRVMWEVSLQPANMWWRCTQYFVIASCG